MKKNNRKKSSKNFSGKWILFVVLIVFVFIQVVTTKSLFYKIKPLKNKDNNIVLKYSNEGKINTKINLTEDSGVDFENYENYDAYIVHFVKSFDIYTAYKFKADKKVNMKGSYKITAFLSAYYKESTDISSNPKIWEKSEVLVDEKISFENDNYSHGVPLNLDMQKYLDQMIEFQNANEDLPINGYIIIKMDVDLNGKESGEEINNSYSEQIKIPITSSIVKIDNYSNEPEEKIVYYDENQVSSKSELFISTAFVILNFICLLITSKGIFLQKKLTAYETEIRKILRNYDDIIIKTSTAIDLDKYTLIEIEEFKELLNLSRESSIPIFYYNFEKKKTSLFYIIKEDMLYIYVIKELN